MSRELVKNGPTNGRNKSCSPGWAFEAGGGTERWQAEGRFFLLLKEEIIPRYKITALPRCSFGLSLLSLSPSSSSSHTRRRVRATRTNTNLKGETALTASSHEESCYRLTNKIRMTLVEKRIFYDARSSPLNVTWHCSSKNLPSFDT